MEIYICKTKYDFNHCQLQLIKNGYKWHSSLKKNFFDINNALTLKREKIKPTYQIYTKDKTIIGWDCDSNISYESNEIINVNYREQKLKRILNHD